MKQFNKIIQYYDALTNLYVDKITEHNDCYFMHSDIIDDGIWNFILIKNNDKYREVFDKYKNKFKDRVPRFYLLNPTEKQFLKLSKQYNIYCEDSWFLTDIKDLKLNYKSKVKVKIKDRPPQNDVVETIMAGFSTQDPNDPYGDLSPTYRTCLEEKFNIMGGWTIKHFVVYLNDNPVSCASITFDSQIAYLNNVTTLKEYKGLGIAKELLSEIINFLKNNQIKEICFATEKDAYTEKFYLNLGFKIQTYGYCFEEK